MLKCFDLQGKTAIITGAGGDLGKVFAKAISQAGAPVFLLGRSLDKVAAVSRDIRESGGQSDCCSCDISNEVSINDAVAMCIAKYGKVDILVNCAGYNRINLSPMDTDTDTYNKVVQTNLIGTLNICKACARDMMKRKWGRIVNISSISGLIVNKGVFGGSYEVTKAAMIMMTKTLAVEWGKEGICVNSIAPGYFATQSNKNFFAADETFYGKVLGMIPMGRLAEPEELIGALILLCSQAASYMQGECIVVDGGYTCW